ncbi:MAG TPA: hypothetical protein VH370_16420 [Humisphaera sp.]|jgi:hypothetical protein|nr:hypothetical protein [Humisphaera sp.]
MTSLNLQLTLPDDLAREAERRGLLSPQAIEGLLREKLRRENSDRLGDIFDRSASAATPLTAEEINAEIDAVRRERRRTDANRP